MGNPWARKKTISRAPGKKIFLRKGSAGWRTIGSKKIYARSIWEANYGRYLQWQMEKMYIKKWDHEPHTFWFENIKRGVRSYLPDFKVTRPDGSHYWVEVKGFYDSKSLTKIKRMRKYYPSEELLLIDGKWFRDNNNKMRIIITDWERGEW